MSLRNCFAASNGNSYDVGCGRPSDLNNEDLRQRNLRCLSQRLLTNQEDERRRIVRDLHDEAGQLVSFLQLELAALRRADTDAERSDLLDESSSALERLALNLADLARDLRPPMLDSLGLVPSLRWFLEHRLGDAPLRSELRASEDLPPLSNPVATAMFRVAEEGLANTLRHAEASYVHVSLRVQESGLLLEIKDDGRGFEVSCIETPTGSSFGTLGLLTIQEHLASIGGRLAVASEIGGGTQLAAWAPLQAPLERDEREQR